MRRVLVVIAVSVFLCSISYAQDSQATSADPPAAAPPPSLGEISRQLKLKKQQKEAQSKPIRAVNHDSTAADTTPEPQQHKAAHIVTNEDASEAASVSPISAHESTAAASDSQSGNGDQARAEHWKSQIQAQKSAVASMQQEITALSHSIHFAGGNCIANCAQWNERQEHKQQEVESMKAQVEEQQKRLEEMQESARKEGFGSAVYDP